MLLQSLLESLQTEEENKIMREIKTELKLLSYKTVLCLQWIPSHCGIGGNERADTLSKTGSKTEQPDNPLTYSEAKTRIKATLNENWKQTFKNKQEDNIEHIERADQVVIFRLRTGHCQLLSHLYKLKISHTNECPCGTDIQTVEHYLKHCPTFLEQRREIWSRDVELTEMLWGSAADLRLTASYVKRTGLKV